MGREKLHGKKYRERRKKSYVEKRRRERYIYIYIPGSNSAKRLFFIISRINTRGVSAVPRLRSRSLSQPIHNVVAVNIHGSYASGAVSAEHRQSA